MSTGEKLQREFTEAKRELDGIRSILLMYEEARHWEQDPDMLYRDEVQYRDRVQALEQKVESLRQRIATVDRPTERADDEKSVSRIGHRVAIVKPWAEILSWLRADPERLYQFTPELFEEFVLERLNDLGFSAEPIGHTNRPDGGIDIVARASGPIDYLLAVQVASHNSRAAKTGAPKVREFAGALEACRGIFSFGLIVTNTSFTEPAIRLMQPLADKLRRAAYPELCSWLAGSFLTAPALEDRVPSVIELPGGPKVSIPRSCILDAQGRPVRNLKPDE